jgi:hypothetical protein
MATIELQLELNSYTARQCVVKALLGVALIRLWWATRHLCRDVADLHTTHLVSRRIQWTGCARFYSSILCRKWCHRGRWEEVT